MIFSHQRIQTLRHSKGFTLLETLVALFILSITVIAAVMLATEQTQQVSDTAQKNLAHIVAMNALATSEIFEPWPSLGKQINEVDLGERNWFVEQTVEAATHPKLRRLTIRVSDQPLTNTSSALVTIQSIRMDPSVLAGEAP